MLRDLTIENLALVKSVSMPFEPGFTVFTGETGAGKSLLINSLALIGGSKADAGLVRSGADKAVVEAVFDRPEGLPAEEYPGEDAEIIVRRELPVSGRQRITLGGAQLPAEKLAALSPWLLEIHGQHAGQALLREDRHLELLDRFAGLGVEAASLRMMSTALYELKQAAAEDEAQRKARRDKLATLEFQVNELAAAKLSADEQRANETEHIRLARAEKFKALAGGCYHALYEDEKSLLAALAQVEKHGRDLLDGDPAAADPVRLLTEASALLKEAAYAFRDYDAALSLEPERLLALEQRLDLYHSLARKYGGTLESALNHLTQCEAELAALKAKETAVARAGEEIPAQTAAWNKAAAALQKKRVKAAEAMSAAVHEELKELGLEKLRFSVDFLELQNPGPLALGNHTARFRIAPNPGEPALPLSRIASGGELSRLMLALSLVMAPERGLTLLFDEADAGVGGSVAEAVGRRLKRLAKEHQVLCVTHLPQIAAHGDQHFKVSKQEIGGRTLCSVESLDGKGREEELARMLAGDKLSVTARAHARELLRAASS